MKRRYGWAHLTSGGTVANIEALWVARQVKYFPLAVKDIAQQYDLTVRIQLPNARFTASVSKSDKAENVDIREVDNYQLLLLKPNESIYLLGKYLTSLRNSHYYGDKDQTELGNEGLSLLNSSQYSLTRGTGKVFSEFPPVVFIAGSRHYSAAKAVNLIGIGQQNLIHVDVDSSFRMDVGNLESKLLHAIEERKVPLAVVATAGTTEEGAVDPIHHILDLRTKLERTKNASFWLHIDAAWGGFIRSLFNITDQDRAEALTLKVGAALRVQFDRNLTEWHRSLTQRLMDVVTQYEDKQREEEEHKREVEATKHETMLGAPSQEAVETHQAESPIESGDTGSQEVSIDESSAKVEQISGGASSADDNRSEFKSRVSQQLAKMTTMLEDGEIDRYLNALERLPERFKDKETEPPIDNFRLELVDVQQWIQGFVKDRLDVMKGGKGKRLKITWPDPGVGSSFVAFPNAESITVDPHKLGYAHYPSGCVAFKNDLIRLFIMHKAPYITSRVQDPLMHVPPKHSRAPDVGESEAGDKSARVAIDSFSPFILEGSRPGAAASALWLSVKSVPLNARGHGTIVKESLLAARALYEWIKRWNEVGDAEGEGLDYELIPVTPDIPDTNIVIFVVKKKSSKSLLHMRKVTASVYERFTIQSELGEREYSYSQPFFLSKTTLNRDQYPVSALEDFFERCNLSANAKAEYRRDGLTVLRAAVMNPYIGAAKKQAGSGVDFVRLFVEELGAASRLALKTL